MPELDTMRQETTESKTIKKLEAFDKEINLFKDKIEAEMTVFKFTTLFEVISSRKDKQLREINIFRKKQWKEVLKKANGDSKKALKILEKGC